MAVKSDVKTGHDIAYVTRGYASGCTGAMAYYTSSGEPPRNLGRPRHGRARRLGHGSG